MQLCSPLLPSLALMKAFRMGLTMVNDQKMCWSEENRCKKKGLGLKLLSMNCISKCYALLIWVTMLKCRIQDCNFLSSRCFLCKTGYFAWHYQKANKWFSKTSGFPRKICGSFVCLFVCLNIGSLTIMLTCCQF